MVHVRVRRHRTLAVWFALLALVLADRLIWTGQQLDSQADANLRGSGTDLGGESSSTVSLALMVWFALPLVGLVLMALTTRRLRSRACWVAAGGAGVFAGFHLWATYVIGTYEDSFAGVCFLALPLGEGALLGLIRASVIAAGAPVAGDDTTPQPLPGESPRPPASA